MEAVSSRYTADVKEWVLGKLKEAIEAQELPFEDTDIPAIHSDIKNNKMLYKEQAKWLEEYLETECRSKVDNLQFLSGSTILAIDELSIYADAWGMYCRPGTYMLVQM